MLWHSSMGLSPCVLLELGVSLYPPVSYDSGALRLLDIRTLISFAVKCECAGLHVYGTRRYFVLLLAWFPFTESSCNSRTCEVHSVEIHLWAERR